MVDAERLVRLLRRITADVRVLRERRAELDAAGDPGTDPGRIDEVVLDHVKYRLVTLVEAAIDAAHHIGAAEGFEPGATNADAVRALARHGVLDSEVAEAVARAVGLRNVLVHRYLDVDDGLVVAHLQQLGVFDRFVADLVRAFLEDHDPERG